MAPAHRGGALLLRAGRGAWRAGRIFAPLSRAFLAQRGLLAKALTLVIAIMAAIALINQWSDRVRPAAKPAASPPHDAWLDIARPYQSYELSSPLFVHEKRSYAARRHAAGGGREDILTFGQLSGDRKKPFLRLSIYRHGAEKVEPTTFFVEMARRAAPLGAGVAELRPEPAQATRFGDMETAALTLSESSGARPGCLGFRVFQPQPGLTLAGLACAAEDDQLSAHDLACVLNRLDLLSAGADKPLRDFFGAAEQRNVRGCAETAHRH